MDSIQKQYQNAKNLNTRISIHEKYSLNKQPFGDWIASHYEIQPGFRILELGCGTGDMWKGKLSLLQEGCQLVLTDFSQGMLDAAKANLCHPQVSFRQIDIQRIPYEDDMFDMVIANMMLYHVPDLKKALREVRRVLKPGGSFCCATYGEHGILEYLSRLLGAYGVEDHQNRQFTLQNGADHLEKLFRQVERLDYPDALAVTDLDDLVDYIRSLSSMTVLSTVPRVEICAVLAQHRENGVLMVPKEYGMFVAR